MSTPAGLFPIHLLQYIIFRRVSEISKIYARHPFRFFFYIIGWYFLYSHPCLGLCMEKRLFPCGHFSGMVLCPAHVWGLGTTVRQGNAQFGAHAARQTVLFLLLIRLLCIPSFSAGLCCPRPERTSCGWLCHRDGYRILYSVILQAMVVLLNGWSKSGPAVFCIAISG